jgi:hypothetical protein
MPTPVFHLDEPGSPSEPQWFPDRERRNPYFRFLIRLGMPVSISLVLHAAIFVFLAVKTWNLLARPSDTLEVEAGIVAAGDVAGVFKWPGEAELAMAEPQNAPTIEPAKFSDSTSLSELAKLANPSGADDSGGFGIGDSGRSGILGIGSGAGEGGGGGLGSGFGAGTNIGKAGVWNLHASGREFVYVVDFSGSITAAVDDLKRELKRSIGSLQPTQSFNVVIFFSEPQQNSDRFVNESFAAALVAADTDNKRKFFQWLERKTPRGRTEPVPAMKRALAAKPDAIFFFSDGYFEEKYVEDITRANEGRKTSINCLLFDELTLGDRSDLPKETSGARILRRIAERNGGKLKIVTGNDLGRK